jgi:hypothetical protein
MHQNQEGGLKGKEKGRKENGKKKEKSAMRELAGIGTS